MSAILLTGPAVEPVPLDDAKSYLRVEHDDDDAVIAALVAGARVHVETQTRRALITQTWRLTLDGWPPRGRLAVLPVPLQAVEAARVYAADGATQTVAADVFVLDRAAAPVVLSFSPAALPSPGRIVAGIEIDFTAGYGDDPADVPQPLRQAIRLLTSHWYENRGLVAVGQTVAALPDAVSALIAPYRVLSL